MSVKGWIGTFSPLNQIDTTCTTFVYTSSSIQGHQRASCDRWTGWHGAPTHPLPAAHTDSSMKGFGVFHKSPGKKTLLWSYCPDVSSLALSVLFSFQICRNMASSMVFSEQYHSQLKEKKKTVKLFLPMPSALVPFTELRRSSEESHGFPCRMEVRLSARLLPCHVSQYRRVDRAACLSSQHLWVSP